jgi:archaellum component FlaG (FlaF/FlaG flagellin family)
MTMKRLMLTTALILIVSALSFSQGNYEFLYDKHDFGVIEEGVIATYEFEFTNTGKDSLFLKRENVRPSCGCTTPKLTEGKIAPGAKGVITAEYNTIGRVGAFNKTIHIFDSTNIVKVLTIKGIVVKKEETPVASEAQMKKSSQAEVDKTEHGFGKIERGQIVSYKFNIKNTGKDTLKISSAQSACSCINYRLANPKDMSTIQYVLPGKSAVLEINYNPSATGKNRDIVTLFTNDPSKKRIPIILTADVVETLIEKSPVKQEDFGSPFQK